MNIQQDIQLPAAGEPISQSWGKQMTEAVNRSRVGGGAGTMTESSKLGTYVSNKARRRPYDEVQESVGGAAAVLCRITGGSSAAGYSVDLYPDGIGVASTSSGTLYIVEIAAAGDLPVGSLVLGWPSITITTGGNEDDV